MKLNFSAGIISGVCVSNWSVCQLCLEWISCQEKSYVCHTRDYVVRL